MSDALTIGIALAIGLFAGGVFGYIYWIVMQDDER